MYFKHLVTNVASVQRPTIVVPKGVAMMNMILEYFIVRQFLPIASKILF